MKRIAGFIAVMCMLVSFPLIAKAQIIDSGVWMNSSTWTLDSNGTLTISGHESISDAWAGGRPRPGWYEYRESITSIKINEGINYIGVYAFDDCTNLVNVELPNTLTEIAGLAFRNCSSLKDIYIPAGVKYIGHYDGWPMNVDSSFSGCNQLKYRVSSNNPNFTTIDGVLYSKDATEIIDYRKDMLEPNYIIPSHVTSIGDYAFHACEYLKSVEIPNSVTNIGHSAFNGCKSLTSVKIPDSVTSIEYGIFGNCSNLKSIEIPLGIKSIDDYAFEKCDNLTDVYYGGSMLDWIRINIGINNEPLKNANIHYRGYCGAEGDNLIWTYDKSGTLTISGNGEMADYAYGDARAPWNSANSSIKKVIIDEGVTKIGNHAFDYCSAIESVKMPNTITVIGDYAFNDCDNLLNIDLSTGLNTIGDYAFNDCTALKTIKIPTNVSSVGDCVFGRCTNITNIELSDNLILIGDSAFYSCASLKTIDIPRSVSIIGDYLFDGCDSLEAINVDINNKFFHSVDGVLFDTVTSTLIKFPVRKDCASYKIPDNVVKIDENAFSNCSGLTDVDIPYGVKTIGDNSFVNCTGLRNIVTPDSVTYIGNGAFENCSNLENIIISRNIEYMGTRFLGGCNKIESLTIPNGEIGMFPFNGTCPNLKELNLLPGVRKIGYMAFDGASIETLTIPGSVKEIGSQSFIGCENLKSVVFSEGVTSTGSGMFAGCSNLTTITIPNSMERIVASLGGNITDIYYSGTEEQWNKIDIGMNNEGLSNAHIYFNYNMPLSETTVQNDVIMVSTNLDNIVDSDKKEKSRIYVGLYDENDALIDAYIADYDGTNIEDTLKKDERADHIKVFVWDKEGNLTPISSAAEYISL